MLQRLYRGFYLPSETCLIEAETRPLRLSEKLKTLAP